MRKYAQRPFFSSQPVAGQLTWETKGRRMALSCRQPSRRPFCAVRHHRTDAPYASSFCNSQLMCPPEPSCASASSPRASYCPRPRSLRTLSEKACERGRPRQSSGSPGLDHCVLRRAAKLRFAAVVGAKIVRYAVRRAQEGIQNGRREGGRSARVGGRGAWKRGGQSSNGHPDASYTTPLLLLTATPTIIMSSALGASPAVIPTLMLFSRRTAPGRKIELRLFDKCSRQLELE
ncbi:hypothetical protein BV20DRAFT_361087 [Pilatotrama ljubarskyi]|nr:hypothetical protein BV20DRAFT_361087 [Pilatotrama ljubarskyi]